MKTTLKRGIGRSAELNGNGRAVYPPAIGPVMRRYRQPEPETRSGLALFGKILLWVALVALMLSGGVLGGTYLYVERDIAQALGPNSVDVEIAQEKLDAVIPGEATTALVVGYDKRLGSEEAETGNSDTLMLLRADPDVRAVTMLSFPRDLLVDVQCEGRPTFVGRINSAYKECGSSGSLLTVRNLTGIPINYLITVNFRGFKQVVSHLGGVWLDVDRRYFNDRSGPGGYATIDLMPGYQKLNGQNALDFVRYRHADSDIFRLARQQMFVKALKHRMAEFNVLDLPKLVSVLTKNVEVGKGDGTDFDVGTILDYALFAYDLPAGHVFQVKIDPACYQGDTELTVAESCVQQAVQDFTQPDVDAPAKATAVALRRRPAASAGPPPSETSVMVLNGNGVAGAATTASSQLAARGYQMLSAPNGDANAPSWEYFNTEVYYDESEGAKAAATRIASLFGDARVGPLPAEIEPLSYGAVVTVILGQTYHGSIAPAAADRTPKRQPPQVSLDSSTLPLVREASARVPYTLYRPTVLATGYHLDSTMPINVYGLGGRNAVRMTFTNGVDFWGIQQTSWEDAPALGDPNEITTIKRRQYRLYYSGSHLRMVVLETPESTVWVVNTLLDKLSNETMLEIAKSLRPVPRR